MNNAYYSYNLHGSLVRKKKTAAAISCNKAKLKIKPTHPEKTRAIPPITVPMPSPIVIKIVLIDIIVPRDSGSCSSIKLVVAGKPKPRIKPPVQKRGKTIHKLEIRANAIKPGLDAIREATTSRFLPTLLTKAPPVFRLKEKLWLHLK